ncbi:N-acetylmuramoyl-L-alanine amidase [Bradyrhizobium symbiodeficiens]|uniref:N-acetylmuramoyl-L-alanine amidase n=1 Tax=Bradyrhizobium symbiodeficiens TaxID=1404367 RepID=UPI001390550C|nr:peptidoglycan recognition family protein [Bradyrhizobium symbiodeficiens]
MGIPLRGRTARWPPAHCSPFIAIARAAARQLRHQTSAALNHPHISLCCRNEAWQQRPCFLQRDSFRSTILSCQTARTSRRFEESGPVRHALRLKFFQTFFWEKVMVEWKGIVGTAYTADEFDSYAHALRWSGWRPAFIVVHNTAVPTLAQRPNGFTKQHILNLEGFYRDQQHWKAGPHLFIDDRQIWVFTPLTMSGVHSPSYNKTALGFEMLGDYDRDEFNSGRGLRVQRNAVAAVATMSAVLGLDPDTMKVHKEDPLTTHACPGRTVVKNKFIEKVKELLAERHGGEHLDPVSS